MKISLVRALRAAFLVAGLSATSLSWGGEAEVKALLLKKYPAVGAAAVVKKLDIGGLYEVNLLGQEAYTNEKVEFLLVGGSLVDAKSLEDVTAKRRPQFLRDFYQGLPLGSAIKTVYGKGERSLVSFEDPDCPYCRAQHADWAKDPAALNATVYTFMFPLSNHPDARRKAEFIMCQPDPSAAWSSWMTSAKGLPLAQNGALLSSAVPSCPDGVAKVKAGEELARAMGYHETPRFIFAHGMGANGYLTMAQFQEAFVAVQRSLAQLAQSPIAPPASASRRVEKAK